MKNTPNNHFEKQTSLNNTILCGIDEVGRGCLAGPVVTAAAILKSTRKNSLIKDSKLLNETQLEKAYSWLIKNSTFAVSIIDHRRIDQHNIYQATQISMCRAYYQLCAVAPVAPKVVLVDAVKLPLNCQVISLYKGEKESISIAAASIIAKVTRDRIMKRLSKSFPLYSLHEHKGYATKIHYKALFAQGSSPMHRMSFLKNYQQALLKQINTQIELFEP
ncbi:MAG: ribonuclease HII [Candidatus Babeliaceae bacterium]|nr:ribonuclease HII [Candidatus Babeliaceae bacterium]